MVRTIIDAARNQENQKEPGPWNKAGRKKGKLFGKTKVTNDLGFDIHQDEEDEEEEDVNKPCVPPIPIKENEIRFNKPFIYPNNFFSKSKPIKGWAIPVTTEEHPDKNTLPKYKKFKLYPRPNMEFQPEELKAYYILKKRGIENAFTKERDIYWGNGPNYNIRLYPHFAKQSKPQKLEPMDAPYIPDKVPGLKVAYDEIYNKEEKVERQFEEILALRIKWNKTIVATTDMEETMCTTSEKVARRKSFFPLRKSLAPAAFKASNRMSVMAEESEENEKSMANYPNKEITKPEQEIVKVTAVVKEVNANIKETQQIVKTVTIKETTVYEERTSMVMSQQKQTENKDQVENVTNEVTNKKPFEIFTDESVVEVKENKSPSTTAALDDFQFKTPALPIANSTAVAGANNKLPFEIFTDENQAKNSPSAMPKPDFGCGTGGFFDPEETCSTQTFNIFLKAQSVSTPKAITKAQPQRQFGNIIKEVVPSPLTTTTEQQDEVVNDENVNYIAAAAAANVQVPVAVYSPPRQQLSTILETSEHGTTQGTHTTGATTKSTISSPEFDIDSHAQTTTNPPTATPLETVKELSCESSRTISPTQNVDKMMNSLKIQNVTDFNISKPQTDLATPGGVRLQKTGPGSGPRSGGLDFSIFEDTMDNKQQKVGNFSRLEEKEDTAAGAVFKALPPIRFQDDKTETIPKMLLTAQQVRYQEDKTETISKMLFAPAAPIQFQEDKTETISKMLLGPPQPIKFPEDKTETISKFMLKPPEPKIFEDEEKSNEKQKTMKNIPEPMTHDDSFEFFGQTPPKGNKSIPNKQTDKGPLSNIRTAADTRTPLTFDSKRFCDKDTPDIQKAKNLSKPIALFEDELMPSNKPSGNIKNNSFLPDFSIIQDSQPVAAQNKEKPFKTKSVFRDSFMPDFSLIEDSQPPAKPQMPKENPHKTINESILPEFSLIENTQPKSKQTEPNDSIIISSQPVEPRILKQTSMKSSMQTSYQQKMNDNMHWKETPNPKSIANRTQEGTTLKNILMDSFMKDFSEIKEPPPVPKDIKEITMVQPSKNNSTLRFLNESLSKPTEQSNTSRINNISSTKETKLSFLAPAPPPPKDKSPNKEKKRSSGSNSGGDDDKFFELNCETEMFGTNISMIKNSTWLPNHGPSSKGNAAKQLSQIQEQSLHIKPEEFSTNSSTLKSQPQPHTLSSESSRKSKLSFIDKSINHNDFSIEISASELAAIKQKQPKPQTDKNPIVIQESPDRDDDNNCEMSIYYKHTPKTPKPQVHIWDDADAFKTPSNNHYVHPEINLNETHQVIENICIDPNVNPFNVDLINAFIEQHDVIGYIENLPTCKLVGCIQRLKQHTTINIKGVNFEVLKLIGEGAYGAVFW